MAERPQLTDVLSQKAIAEIHHVAIKYLKLMKKRDRFVNFAELSKTLDKLGGPSSKENRQSWLASWEVLLEHDLESYDFARNLTRLGFLNKDRSSVNPAGYYFVNEQLKTVYCSIPKNACTLFKTMLVDNSEFKDEFEASDKSVHEFFNQRVQASSATHLLECLSSKEYFKYVVLRNPFDRIVSGYLDKFAKHVIPEEFVQNIILEVQASLGLAPNVEQSITFSQFVDYLATTPDSQLNDHWRPQNNFVSAVDFDFVGQFEFMDGVIKSLESTLNVHIRKQVSSHITHYKVFENPQEFQSMYPHELRKLEGLPTASQLVVDEVKTKLSCRYEEDLKIYREAFEKVA